MTSYDEYDITVELDGKEYECTIKAHWCGSEPDVGIMGAYIDEWWIDQFTVDGVTISSGLVGSHPMCTRLNEALEPKVEGLEPPEPDYGEDYD